MRVWCVCVCVCVLCHASHSQFDSCRWLVWWQRPQAESEKTLASALGPPASAAKHAHMLHNDNNKREFIEHFLRLKALCNLLMKKCATWKYPHTNQWYINKETNIIKHNHTKHSEMHTHTQTCTHKHTHKHAHTHTNTHTQTRTHTGTHTHTHTQACTRTHMIAHTHTRIMCQVRTLQ